MLVFMLGLVIGSVFGYLTKKAYADVDTTLFRISVTTATVFAGIYITILFFHTCWVAFKLEQEELIDTLRDNHSK